MVWARTAGWIVTALCSFQATAAEPGFYFGIAGGQAKYDFEKVQAPTATLPPASGGVAFAPIPRFSLPPAGLNFISSPVAFIGGLSPFGVSGGDHEDDDTSWSALAGYRISRYFAAEVSYVSLGKLTARDTLYVYPTFAPITMKHTLDTQGPTLTMLAILPARDNWDIYIRFGAFFVDSKLESSIGASKTSTTFGSDGVVAGFGTQYNFGEHWSVRLDLQRYQDIGEKFATGEADIDNVSFGVLYRL